jgi:hypothetical protein
MANRCDFNSVFPRQMKRIWTMTNFKDAHEAGSFKRDMIAAHAVYKAYKNKKQKMENSDSDG